MTALPSGRIEARGALTEAVRATIREHKSAILAELAANDGTSSLVSPAPARASHPEAMSVGAFGSATASTS